MVIRHRTVKQVIIAALFFSFWVSLGFLVWFIAWEPAPPPPPPPREARPLDVAAVHVVRAPDGRVDVLGIINNPNTDAGAVRVPYELVVSRGGEEVAREGGVTYALPAHPSYVMELALDVPDGEVNATLEIGDPVWHFVDPVDFTPPSIVRVTERTAILPARPEAGLSALFEVKGLLANESLVGYRRVDVTAIGRDAGDNIVGFGMTEMGDMLAGERREATVQWPALPGRDVHVITWFANVNVFADDAVIVVPGEEDPGIAPGGIL